MGNRLAQYRNGATLGTVRYWWKETFGEADEGETVRTPTGLSILDLYDSYCEFTTPRRYTWDRMDANTFAKCLVANKIMEVDGQWAMRPTWEPREYQLTRAVADVPVDVAVRFFDGK